MSSGTLNLEKVVDLSIERIHSFLVHPRKGVGEKQQVIGTEIPLKGPLFDLVHRTYANAEHDCNIDIIFRKSKDGSRQNACRDLVTSYLATPELASGLNLAKRLEVATTHRSGLGLLFLIQGKNEGSYQLVISRFPAGNGVLDQGLSSDLTVDFLERVLMKSAFSYKSVLYAHRSLSTGFWQGRAADKQINDHETKLSNYWISDFLDSEVNDTPAAGTRRLALALRDAARKISDAFTRSEIAAAVTLAPSLQNKETSIQEFVSHFGLSELASAAVKNELRDPSLANCRFRFDVQEFIRQYPLEQSNWTTALCLPVDPVN